MKKAHLGERGISPIIIIGIVAFVALGAVYFTTSQSAPQKEQRKEQNKEQNIPTPSAQTSRSFENLRAELGTALTSGGIHPARFASMNREIDALATEGVDVSELRTLLSKLSVGESEKPKPSAPTPTPSQTQQTQKPSPPPQPKEQAAAPNVTPPPPPPQQQVVTERVETRPFWEYDPAKPEMGWYWAREGTPPACPESFLVMESPIETDLVTAILYPGQVRGDGPEDFKPHGGFTLKPNSKIEIRAPWDGYLTSVAKFTDEFGYHVSLTFEHPCGMLFGGGHWGVLPPDIQAVVDKVPLKAYGDSRTEQIMPPYFVKKGQVIVTGLQEKARPERPGFDWGVADHRQRNTASKDPRFRELYGYAPWNTYYGVCWLDLLPPDQKAVLKSLPGGDGKQGKNSEYCK